MLTLLVAWRAAALIGDGSSSLITAFYMPSRHSQGGTKTAAHTLAEELGVELERSRSTTRPIARCERRARCSAATSRPN